MGHVYSNRPIRTFLKDLGGARTWYGDVRWLSLCLLFLVSLGCGGARTTAAERTLVRLDVIARALAQAEASYDAARCRPPTPCDDLLLWNHLAASLQDAEQRLQDAEQAVARWQAGDPRSWANGRDRLHAALDEVRQALDSLGLPEPPGLAGVALNATTTP